MTDIAAAETAAIVEHEAGRLSEGLPGQVQASTRGVRFIEMRGPRYEAFVDRDGTESRFHDAGERQAMAGERLGAADPGLGALAGENGTQGEGFRAIASHRRGGMGIHIADLGG